MHWPLKTLMQLRRKKRSYKFMRNTIHSSMAAKNSSKEKCPLHLFYLLCFLLEYKWQWRTLIRLCLLYGVATWPYIFYFCRIYSGLYILELIESSKAQNLLDIFLNFCNIINLYKAKYFFVIFLGTEWWVKHSWGSTSTLPRLFLLFWLKMQPITLQRSTRDCAARSRWALTLHG